MMLKARKVALADEEIDELLEAVMIWLSAWSANGVDSAGIDYLTWSAVEDYTM